MSASARRFLPAVLIIIILSLITAGASSAQTDATATLTPPDTSAFPYLTAYLDVHDPAGEFVHGLSTQDVTLQENGVQIPATMLEEKKPGVQFVIAITSSDTFTIRDGLGVSRYDYLLQGLMAGTWVDHSSGVDDFSLLTLGGPQLTHVPDPADIVAALNKYEPSAASNQPSLELLASALQLASDPTLRPGMGRSILFITPPQSTDVALGLQSIIASANQQDIRVNVWLVAGQDVFDLPAANQLRNLAEQTHGSFFAFSYDETVPDLETLLEPGRYVYSLGYESHIATAGTQQLAAQVSLESGSVTTPQVSFQQNLAAPVPVLETFPERITRTFRIQSTSEPVNTENDLIPVSQPLTIQVSFPDGYPRPLVSASLFVDGGLAAQNTSPPFDQLTWDLQPYTQNGSHTLRIEVVDSLGLTGSTDEASIRIIVPTTRQGILVTFSQKRPLVYGVIGLILASILGLVLILGGHIRPKLHPGQVIPPGRPRGFLHQANAHQNSPPFNGRSSASNNTEATPPQQGKPGRMKWTDRLPWVRRKEAPIHVLAYLIPLVGSEEPTLPAPLQITMEDVSLGTDTQLANLVISHPSLEGLHSRIHHDANSFILTDMGSVAGTWVNFDPVPAEGVLLQHADVIHLGSVGFRFILSNPGPLPRIVVTPSEPEA